MVVVIVVAVMVGGAFDYGKMRGGIKRPYGCVPIPEILVDFELDSCCSVE